MEINILKKGSFSRKLFFIILGISSIPLIISFLFLIKIETQVASFELSSVLFVFLILLLLIIGLSVLGTVAVYKQINSRIINFNRSATEIARGNFNHNITVESDDELGKLAKIFNFMTKEFRNLEKKNLNKIINEKEKTKTILKNIGDGVIVTDKSHKILVLNAIAESWFGLAEPDVINQPIEKLIYEEKLLDLINKIKDGGNQEDTKVEIQIKPANQTKEIVLQAKSTQVVSADNGLIGIVTTFRDVTREKEIDKMKTELVSMVAHELRSPLTSIAGFSELLLDEGLSQEQSKDYADIILTESKRLSDLINKFLDISRIESGRSQIYKTSVNMGDVIRSILGMNQYLAESKGIEVDLNIPEDIPDVYVDREMMGEVILNIFSNAVKYSSDGKKIFINIEETENEQIIKIIDQGFGISEKSLDKIFDKFYRVTDNEKVQEITGSGLGLSLVKEIVQQHGGSIWAESELNKGSTFSISLPKYNGQDSQQDTDLPDEENYLIE